MRTRAIVLWCVMSLCWGSGWIFSPELAQAAQPFAAAALAMAVAAAVLGSVALVLRVTHGRGTLPRAGVRSALWLSLVMLSAPTVLLVAAGAHGLGGWPLLLYALLPLLTGFADDRWSMAMVLAAGAVFLLIDRTISFELATIAWALPALAAVALQAFGLRYAARVLHGTDWSQILSGMALQAVVAAVLLAGCSALFDAHPRIMPPAQWSGAATLALAYLGIAGVAVPYLLLYSLLATGVLRPEQVAAGQWLQTLCVVGESAFFVRARVPWSVWLAAVVLTGCMAQVLGRQQDDSPPTIAS